MPILRFVEEFEFSVCSGRGNLVRKLLVLVSVIHTKEGSGTTINSQERAYFIAPWLLYIQAASEFLRYGDKSRYVKIETMCAGSYRSKSIHEAIKLRYEPEHMCSVQVLRVSRN